MTLEWALGGKSMKDIIDLSGNVRIGDYRLDNIDAEFPKFYKCSS